MHISLVKRDTQIEAFMTDSVFDAYELLELAKAATYGPISSDINAKKLSGKNFEFEIMASLLPS